MTTLAYILAGRKMDGRLKRQLEFILETDAGDTCAHDPSEALCEVTDGKNRHGAYNDATRHKRWT